MFIKIKETAKHGIIYGLGQTLNSVVSFMLIPLYTQHLSTSEYAINGLLSTSTTIISAVFSLGLNSALFRSYYEYDTVEERKTVVTTTFFTLLMSFICVGIIGYIGASTWSLLILGEYGFDKYCIITFWTAGIQLLQSIPFAVFRAKKMSKKYAGFSFLFLTLRLGFIIYLIIYRHYGVWGIVLGNFTATLLSSIIMFFAISDFMTWRYSFSEAKQLLRFGLPLIVVNLAGFILNSSDRYFLRVFGDLDQVGVYILGSQFGRVVQLLLAQPLGLVWPAVMFSVAKKEYADKYYSRMLTYTLFVGVCLWLGLSSFSREVIMLLASSDYWEAYKVVPVVSFSYLIFSAQNILNVGIALKRRTEYYAFAFVIASISNLILNTVLIPVYGVIGAAYATLLSFILVFALKYVFARKFYFVPYEWGRILKLLGGAIVLYMLTTFIEFNSLFLVIFLKSVCIAFFPVVLYILAFFDAEEIVVFRRFAKSGLQGALDTIKQIG